MNDLDHPVLIVGAAGGIGSALARRLAGHADLILAGRHGGPLEALRDEIGGTVAIVDATDRAALQSLASQQAHGGRLAIVNAVGSILLKAAHRTTPSELDQVLAQNLVTAFNVVATAGAVARNGGSVVCFSTAAAAIGLANHEAIAAAKAGVEGLVRSAAATYATNRLRVNAIAPGLVDTPLAAPITSNERMRTASAAMHPLGRIGTAAEVAIAVHWLLTAEWVTGQVIGVDGGLGRVRPAR